MPTYSYKCNECGNKFDEFSTKVMSSSEDTIHDCPKCKSKNTKRIMTKPAENPFGTVEGWFKFS
ncbi:MAG: zinc ribbon domain-containing protein [Ignavibacterium sp.]|jgi:putative FmdB family regulatory protein|nr:zinc ribbon domain-containing protein [Ignavibacterium sp.]